MLDRDARGPVHELADQWREKYRADVIVGEQPELAAVTRRLEHRSRDDRRGELFEHVARGRLQRARELSRLHPVPRADQQFVADLEAQTLERKRSSRLSAKRSPARVMFCSLSRASRATSSFRSMDSDAERGAGQR
jgi:hypothetical protein